MPSKFKSTGPRGKKKSPKPLDSADDYHEAAEVAEQTGGKHRAGDVKKSARAFASAMDIYTEGVARFPTDTDLAYNKARLEADLSQQPSLISNLPTSGSTSLLQFQRQALASANHVLSISEDDPEAMFNAAQVMTTLAESLSDPVDTEAPSLTAENAHISEAVALLRQAIDLLTLCFIRQQELLQEYNTMDSIVKDRASVAEDKKPAQASPVAESTDGGASREHEMQSMSVTVRSATTVSDLLDTACAALAAMTLLISLDDDQAHLIELYKAGQELSDGKIPQYLSQLPSEEQAPARTEAGMTVARFQLGLAAKSFVTGGMTLQDYVSRLDLLDTVAPPDAAARDVDVLSAQADERMEVASTILAKLADSPGSYEAGISTLLWELLSSSQKSYGAACKLETSPDLTLLRKAALYSSRAEVDLLRFRLVVLHRFPSHAAEPSSQWPLNQDLPVAVRNSAITLLLNAQIFYSNAVKLYQQYGDMEAATSNQQSNLVVEWAIAVSQGNQPSASALLVKVKAAGPRWVQAAFEIEQGLIPGHNRQ